MKKLKAVLKKIKAVLKKYKEKFNLNKKNTLKICVFFVAIAVFCTLLCVIIGGNDTLKNVDAQSANIASADADEEDEKNDEQKDDITRALDKKYAAIEKDKEIKKAYLTFDDGPSKNTTKILDILDEYDVKATFFVIYNKNMEPTYKEIVDRGHAIALHSYCHNYNIIYKSKDAYYDDLNKLSDYVELTTGVKSKIIRFPGGSSNGVSSDCPGLMTELTKDVKKKGYKYFDWNASNDDAEALLQPTQTLIDAVKRDISGKKNACLLMHDAEVKTTTVEALPSIISYLKDLGYTMIPITNNTKEFHHAKLSN